METYDICLEKVSHIISKVKRNANFRTSLAPTMLATDNSWKVMMKTWRKGGLVGYPSMHCVTTIISTVDRFRRRRIFNMDALVCQQAQAELLVNSPILQLHCCDLRVNFSFTVPCLPFIRIKKAFFFM